MAPGSTRSTSTITHRSSGSSSSTYATVTPDTISYSHSRRLAIPRSFRDASAWSAVFSDITKLLLNDYSLSKALGHDPDASLSSATRLSAPLLTDHEAKEYAAWEKDARNLPRADWRRLRTETNASTSAQKARWEELTNALRALYKEDGLRAENCKAWVEKYQDKMSLLVAARKIETTRSDMNAANKAGGKAKKHVHELVACRKVMNEVGKYRHEMGAVMRATNKDANEKEEDVSKRLGRLERDAPRKKDGAADLFKERSRLYEKLGKARKDRLEVQMKHGRQQAEMNVLEGALRARMNALERAVRRGGSSSRR